MFWHTKKPEYEIVVPPLSKPFKQLSKTEAQAFFDWHMSKLEERIDYLRTHTKLNLDYSPKSLVPLWKWFLKRAEIEDTPQARLQTLEQKLTQASSPFTETVLRENARQLSFETECIIRDIAMYLGEMFVKSHPSVYWGFYTTPKTDIFVNHPLLLGFPNSTFPERSGVPFEPVHMARVKALRLLDGTAAGDDLLLQPLLK